MKRYWAVLAGIVACGNHAPAPRSVSVAPLPARDQPRPVVASTFCEHVLAEQRDALARAIASQRRKSPDDWKHVKDDAALLRELGAQTGVACHAFAGGAWALELAKVDVDPYARMVRGEVVPVAYIHDLRTASDEGVTIGYGELTSALASDYDGDGTPELYVELHTVGPEGGDGVDAKLLTYARGAIAPYPKAPPDITGPPFDFDGDGRLDVPTSMNLVVFPEASCDSKDYGKSASFLAHSLRDGTFSTTDDVAKSYARKWCPASPAAITSPESALCARLWSGTPALRASNLARATACVQWDCELEANHKPQPKNAARDCDARREAFEQGAPFSLP